MNSLFKHVNNSTITVNSGRASGPCKASNFSIYLYIPSHGKILFCCTHVGVGLTFQWPSQQLQIQNECLEFFDTRISGKYLQTWPWRKKITEMQLVKLETFKHSFNPYLLPVGLLPGLRNPRERGSAASEKKNHGWQKKKWNNNTKKLWEIEIKPQIWLKPRIFRGFRPWTLVRGLASVRGFAASS